MRVLYQLRAVQGCGINSRSRQRAVADVAAHRLGPGVPPVPGPRHKKHPGADGRASRCHADPSPVNLDIRGRHLDDGLPGRRNVARVRVAGGRRGFGPCGVYGDRPRRVIDDEGSGAQARRVVDDGVLVLRQRRRGVARVDHAGPLIGLHLVLVVPVVGHDLESARGVAPQPDAELQAYLAPGICAVMSGALMNSRYAG